jgi:hypothetical protein
MTRPLLPPRGVDVPTHLIYNPLLPPALLQTWIQLRGLAWGRTVTPPLRMQQLASITAKSPATIYSHLSQLRLLSALSWRTSGLGTIIVSFDDSYEGRIPPLSQLFTIQDAQASQLENVDSRILESQDPESQILESQNPESQNLESQNLESQNLGSPPLFKH